VRPEPAEGHGASPRARGASRAKSRRRVITAVLFGGNAKEVTRLDLVGVKRDGASNSALAL